MEGPAAFAARLERIEIGSLTQTIKTTGLGETWSRADERQGETTKAKRSSLTQMAVEPAR
jgi:hypothetical protein